MTRATNTLAWPDIEQECPLVVDLDGTLIRTDMLHESLCRVFRESPRSLWLIPMWLYRGKALLKRQLADCTSIDPRILPYNHDFLDWLRQERTNGRTLVLCTGSDRALAMAIADHLGLFDEVLASNGTVNLAGTQKARALVERFGHAGFDYAGNSHDDLAVWQRARRAVMVHPSPDVIKEAKASGDVERVFPQPAIGFTTWRRLLRLHQWLKNFLLGVPVVAAHQVTHLDTWLTLMLAFVSFGCCASAVYITNDLLDLENDRRHPYKRARPFASGLVPVWVGFALVPLLLGGSLAIAQHVGGDFVPWLLVYFALTCAYSLRLKQLILIDCLTLAMLYTLRIIAGAAATHIELSFWLLAFSCFLFLSLSFVKRYAELQILSAVGHMQAGGRGYCVSDAPLIQVLGIASGYAAVVVLALYLNSETVLRLYQVPQFLWAAIPITLFWISWMWTQAHRGQLHEDPVVFAITDRVSILAGLAMAFVLAAGALSWR